MKFIIKTDKISKSFLKVLSLGMGIALLAGECHGNASAISNPFDPLSPSGFLPYISTYESRISESLDTETTTNTDTMTDTGTIMDTDTMTDTETTTDTGTVVDVVSPVAEAINLSDDGVLESGFVVGTASDDTSLSSVSISLDGGSFLPATGTTRWSYKLPAGSGTWKRGETHTITIQVLDSAGNTSITDLSVKKGKNRDIDGNGFPDLVVGADQTGFGTDSGKVYIFYIDESIGESDFGAEEAGSIITGENIGDIFGTGILLDDFNGDGYADVVVAAPSTLQGAVYLFLSPGNGGRVAATTAASANAKITGEASNDHFGESISSGDVNGDGYSDLVVGSSWNGSSAGKIYTFLGAAAGLSTGSAVIAEQSITGEASSSLGVAVSVGDFNGDGYADIAGGASVYAGWSGRVYFVYGSPSIASTLNAISLPAITHPTAFYSFGDTLSVGDFNDDGYSDLFAGSVGKGDIYLFYGGPAGISATTTAVGAGGAELNFSGGAGSYFGEYMAAGDINGDGMDDLAVGASNFSTNGSLFTYYTVSAGPGSAGRQIDGESASYKNFGSSAILDLNGDGFGDLIAGAKGTTGVPGRVYIFLSPGTGGIIATSAAGNEPDAKITGENNGDFFGVAIGQ